MLQALKRMLHVLCFHSVFNNCKTLLSIFSTPFVLLLELDNYVIIIDWWILVVVWNPNGLLVSWPVVVFFPIQLQANDNSAGDGSSSAATSVRDDEVIPGDDDHELDMDELNELAASSAKTSTEIKEPSNIT